MYCRVSFSCFVQYYNYIVMGNIGPVHQKPPRHCIFQQTQHWETSRRDTLTPIRTRKTEDSARPLTDRKQKDQNRLALNKLDTSGPRQIVATKTPILYHITNEKEQKGRNQNSRDGRTKEILKKVKNFSDFLCEIKERIREEDDKAVMGDTIRKGTCRLDSEDKQMSFNETERLKIKPNQKRTLSFEVRLENEKIELQKYRKILDRELVKTHSIDNIQLQGNYAGSKILTIKYEALNRTGGSKTFKMTDDFRSEQLQRIEEEAERGRNWQQEMQVLCEDGNNQYQQTLKRKLVLEEEQIHRKLSDIKDKYDEMLRTVLRVGQQIEEKQSSVNEAHGHRRQVQPKVREFVRQPHKQVGEIKVPKLNLVSVNGPLEILTRDQDPPASSRRIEHISTLFSRLDELCSSQQQTEREMRQALEDGTIQDVDICVSEPESDD